MTEHVILIEYTSKNRFQYVIFLLGLFHYKMACADALWHTHIQPKEEHDDENSLYQHIGILKPGFRRIHNPTWDVIITMSHTIVRKYVATTDGLDAAWSKPTLHNRDELLYIDLCQAMNTGDIGRVEVSFLPWIYIFKATSKDKYLSQISRFLNNLQFNWPESLSDIIQMNLLCNPTGKSVVFRAVDWLVDTLEHIIKESPLIEIYQSCHVTMGNAFHLQHQTIWHSVLNMTKTIKKTIGVYE
ncbi:hypothetical protein BDR06DRAFT_985724 [Suillus hirtellus]|nr:hypothetical protein BDR06DRAFT_985724 [Suillus hirtellus]